MVLSPRSHYALHRCEIKISLLASLPTTYQSFPDLGERTGSIICSLPRMPEQDDTWQGLGGRKELDCNAACVQMLFFQNLPLKFG